MKGNVFILEDDESIASLVTVALEINGLHIRSFKTVEEFISSLSDFQPDVALLDIMLPDGSGLYALEFVKKNYPAVDCIMLSALSGETDRVKGLNLGADDYIPKPFSVLELTARVNARLRRRQKPSVLTLYGIVLDPDAFSCSIDGKPVTINKKEFGLLKYFIENAGKALSREKILSDVWGYDVGETRTLDNHVARLRKLGVKIETVFGVGYKL